MYGRRYTTWFTNLFGVDEVLPDRAACLFDENDASPVTNTTQGLFSFNQHVAADGPQRETLPSLTVLTGECEGDSFGVGLFSTPSLGELRARRKPAPPGALKLSNVVGDVTEMINHPSNCYATFQVASQFNCLEMVNSNVTPELGVSRYEGDHTQGPACSICCGAATVYRNYFVPLTTPDGASQIGQTAEVQIENLKDMELLLNNKEEKYFHVSNGYSMSYPGGIARLAEKLHTLGPEELDALRCSLRVGVQVDAEVTAADWGSRVTKTPDHLVTEVFGSACAVGYNYSTTTEQWAPFASLVLEASYEATLLAAAETAERHGWQGASNVVYLTALGGGVFGNDMAWIESAIDRACSKFQELPLDVRVVTYSGRVPSGLRALER